MMDRYTLKETLFSGIATVTFEKADGSLREMRCTLQPTPRKENLDVLAVWDIDAGGWRSFRMDSIKSIVVG